MKRILSFLLPAAGLAVFALIVYRTGPERIGAVLSAVEPVELLWGPPLVLAICIVRGARWRYVMRGLGIDYSLARSTLVWAIGFFASAVTPAKAGDAVRAVYLRNDTHRPMGEALLTVFVDRLWDLGFILAAGVASALLFSARYIRIPSASLFVAGALLLGAAALVATNRRWMRFLLKPASSLFVPARHRDVLTAGFHAFYDALRTHRASPARSAVMALLTIACWTLIFILAVYAARLVSIPVGAGYIVLIMPIVTLVELIPFSIAGLGTREATVIYFFSVVGIGSAEAVGFSIVYVLLGTYLTALAGFLLWLRHPFRWPRAEQP
jgi:hypothetical protein